MKFVPFYLSYVGTGKPTKTLCVTVHAPMTSLKVSAINVIFLNRKLITEGILRYFCSKSTFDVCRQTGASMQFILLIFASVVLRKVHVHSLLTLETVSLP